MTSLAVKSPFDGTIIKTVTKHSRKDANIMLESAKGLFGDRSQWLPAHERIAILEKLAKLLSDQQQTCALRIAQEGGKPLVDAKIEVARAIDGVKLAVKELPRIMRGEEIPMGLTPTTTGRQAYTTYEPIGPVVAISAFNHPLNLIIHQVIPAVAVGCPVIVKPASTTPLSCLALVELLYQAGLPKNWCQVCVCDSTVAEYLATDPRTAFVTFIGSAQIGWQLRSKIAPGTRCALEHGGNAPVIIDETTAYEELIPLLAKGAFYHAGQVCVSVQRIFAHHSIAEALAASLAEHAATLTVGDPTHENTDIGPLIHPQEVERVAAWVKEAQQQGARTLCGGKSLTSNTYTPTVLYDPSEKSKISQQEIFGPVVAVYPYQKIEAAIKQANNTPFAFQASVFTQNLKHAIKCSQELDATAVIINDHSAFRCDWMPFGGRRHSGLGLGGIGYTMHDMLAIKMTVWRP